MPKALQTLDVFPRTVWLVLVGLLLLRVIGMFFDPNQLYADETQYWIWSQNLDWGYFSKPPLIAWVIAFTTGIFGDADWAVRLAAPFLHTATAIFLGLTAKTLFGDRAGIWTAIGWATLPAVWLSASIISTDGVLMVAWSGGLLALSHLRQKSDWPTAIALGVAIGLGFMAKYAMIYFALGLGLAILIDEPARKALLGLKGLTAALIGLALMSPNLMWNAANDFATVSHTAANANWGGSLFNPMELMDFLGSQLGVFGPAFFIVLIIAIFHAVRTEPGDRSSRPILMLAGFVLPALIIVAGQAFISRAHANWAASAYGAGLIITIAFLVTGPVWRQKVLYGSIAFHSTVGVIMAVLAFSQPASEAVGLANAFKRVRAWDETAEALAQAANELDPAMLAFDNRNDFHQMQRYGAEIKAPLAMWLRYGGPTNHAEQTWPLPTQPDEPVLIVSERPAEVPVMARDFATLEPVGEIRIPIGAGRERHYQLFMATGYQRQPRDEAFETWVADQRTDTR